MQDFSKFCLTNTPPCLIIPIEINWLGVHKTNWNQLDSVYRIQLKPGKVEVVKSRAQPAERLRAQRVRYRRGSQLPKRTRSTPKARDMFTFYFTIRKTAERRWRKTTGAKGFPGKGQVLCQPAAGWNMSIQQNTGNRMTQSQSNFAQFSCGILERRLKPMRVLRRPGQSGCRGYSSALANHGKSWDAKLTGG